MAVWDWRMRHGAVSGPVHAASALTCIAAVGGLPAVGLQSDWILLTGAAGVGAICWRAIRAAAPGTVMLYRIAVWSGAVGWLSHVLDHGWSMGSGYTLAAAGVMGGVLARPVAASQRAAELQREQAAAAAAAELEQDRLHGQAAHWIARIEKICKVRVTVLGIEPWIHPGPDGQPRQTGYTLELELPDDGSTWRDIEAGTTSLAAAEDLPNGCGIEVNEGASRRRCLFEVNTVDALRDDIPLPLSPGPRKIADDLDIGVRRTGALAEINLSDDSVVLVGSTGSGKSNELQTLVARLVECQDTLILVIDKNGGGMALPWLKPWATGEIDNPPIYWVADNDEEAGFMTEWVAELIGARKQSQAAAMMAIDDDKVPVSNRVPQILLITDEAGALPGPIMNRISDISDRGRGSRIRAITCALRGTSEYVPTALLAQARVRIAMRTNDEQELGYLYKQRRRRLPDSSDAPAPGYGFIGVQGGPPAYVHKGYRTTPSRATAVAMASARHRPSDVEPETLELLPPHIRRIGMDRWERTRHIRRAASGIPARPSEAPPTAATPADDQPSQSQEGGMPAAIDNMTAKRRELDEAVAAAAAGRDQDDPGERTFELLAAELRAAVVPELVIRVLAAIGDAERMHTADIAEVLGVRKEALGSLLSQVGIRPLKNAFTIDGTSGRGYARADVEAGAERIRTGETAVPDEIARWRPPS